ncbi:MAG: hypothetical protein ACQETI_02650 [Halobacteriota archaeon]
MTVSESLPRTKYIFLMIFFFTLVAVGVLSGHADYVRILPSLMIENSTIWAPILTGLGGLGTLILAGLYLRQHRVLQRQANTQQDQLEEMKRQADLQKRVTDIQNQQTVIMEQQEEWMEAQHAPEIYIQSWQAVNDEICLFLTNLGNGVARDLTVNYRIVPPGTTTIYANQAEFEVGGAFSLEHDTDGDEVTANVLVPDTEIHQFKATMNTFWLPEGFDPEDATVGTEIEILPFSQAVDRLLDRGIEEIQYEILLQYEYIRREEETVDLWSGVVELEAGMNFQDAIVRSTRDRCPTSSDNVRPENLEEGVEEFL